MKEKVSKQRDHFNIVKKNQTCHLVLTEKMPVSNISSIPSYIFHDFQRKEQL